MGGRGALSPAPMGATVCFLLGLVTTTGHADEVLNARVHAYQANIRSRPGMSAPVQVTVPRGTHLRVVEWCADRPCRWARVVVTSNNLEGYVHHTMIEPVPESAPSATKLMPPPQSPPPSPISRPAPKPGVATPAAPPPPPVPTPTPRYEPLPAVASPGSRDAGRFGLGLAFFSSFGGQSFSNLAEQGGTLSAQYDFARAFKVRATAFFGTGYSILGGQLLLTFPEPERPSSVYVQPYAGGGLSRLSFRGAFSEASDTIFVGSGGILLRLRSNSHWRPYAGIELLLFDPGEGVFEGKPALSGLGVTIGVHYYF